MDVFFRYLDRRMSLTASGNNSVEQTTSSTSSLDALSQHTYPHQLFELLLRVFEDTILNTYRSK